VSPRRIFGAEDVMPDRDPNIPEDEKHPGAPPDPRKRRTSEHPQEDQKGEDLPIGNGGTNEPAAFPPHH
jgi:hypothetical protein